MRENRSVSKELEHTDFQRSPIRFRRATRIEAPANSSGSDQARPDVLYAAAIKAASASCYSAPLRRRRAYQGDDTPHPSRPSLAVAADSAKKAGHERKPSRAVKLLEGCERSCCCYAFPYYYSRIIWKGMRETKRRAGALKRTMMSVDSQCMARYFPEGFSRDLLVG